MKQYGPVVIVNQHFLLCSMAKYKKYYQHTHDIAWFCKIGKCYCHFASYGALLPDFANDSRRNKELQKYVLTELVPKIPSSSVYINEEYIKRRVKKCYTQWDESLRINPREEYIRCFVEMAIRGFWSYDRDVLLETESHENKMSNKYVLIARPKKRPQAFVKDYMFPVYQKLQMPNNTLNFEQDISF